MAEFSERLKRARLESGFETATAAASAHGFVVSTYLGYENGDREPGKASARRIAAAFRISLEWLLTGRGEMRGRQTSIPITGCVGAGALVDFDRERDELANLDAVLMPRDGEIAGLVVVGDSMRPRFLPGEVVLYDPRPVMPAALIDSYAVVQTDDGERTLIKVLRRADRPDRWRLESFNADPEEVELRAAWRYLGVLPGSTARVPIPASGKTRAKGR